MLATSLAFTPVASPVMAKQVTLEQRLESTRLEDVYGYDHVYLKNFYDLTFENTKKTYKMPADLEKAITPSNFEKKQVEVKDKAEFKREVLSIAKKLKYSEEKIRTLKPLEALEMVAKIVAENYTFKFINYDNKSIDQVFETREAKCTDYTYSVIAVFNLVKEMNPHLNNVYVTNHLFSRNIGHAWNTIVVMGKTSVQVAYFDATWYDTKAAEDLNATDKWHVDFERWRSQFYAALNDYDSAQEELRPLIEKTKNEVRLEQLLERSAYYYFLADDYENSLEAYERLAGEFPRSRDRAEYIYYIGWLYFELRDFENVLRCIEILKTQYPDSPYQLENLEKRIKEYEAPKVKPQPKQKPKPKEEPPKPKQPKEKKDTWFIEKDEEWWEMYGP